MKLKIESVKGFYEFVRSVNSIAPGAIFLLSDRGCVVRSRNESQSVRAFFRTNVIKSESEDVTRLPMLDLSKFLQAIRMVVETSKDDDTAEFNVTKQFLTYNGAAKFKLKLFNEAHLVFYTTEDIKTTMTEEFSFNMSAEMLKYVLKYKGITGEKDPKVYIYELDGKVYCEHDDKTKNLIDSVGIAVNDTFTGELRNPICVNINNAFSKFNPLGADEINIGLQSINSRMVGLKVNSHMSGDNFVSAVEIVSKILEK
jgi:hypothetical protein